MAGTGVCCGSLEDHNVLMKMGLSVVLIGHVNFLLGALMQGVVLRYVTLNQQARVVDYSISNVVALTSGLVGIIVGILAIVVSKNKKSRCLTWSLFSASLTACLLAAASALGLSVSVVRTILNGGRSLLSNCPHAIGYSSITNECPFDPTRIYSTTLILWVPLIVTCAVQMVFAARCFAVCISFMGLPCCPRKRSRDFGKSINVAGLMEAAYPEPPRRYVEPPSRYEGPPGHRQPPRRHTDPQRQQRRPPLPTQHPPLLHHSLPPSERRPMHHVSRDRLERDRQDRDRQDRDRQETRTRGEQRPPEQNPLLERATIERSSFWI